VACVVVDSVAGIPPGEVWVRPLPALVGRARALAGAGQRPEPRSSHELPIEQVLALAATMRDAPPAGTFVGIGGSCWDVGTPLTEAVVAGLPAFAAAIAAAIEAYSG
jgi:Ni,Fe-hydrogenase maturation factor